MTPYQAAQALAKHLKDKGCDATAWDRNTTLQRGWCVADAAVACEGGPDIVEMQLDLKGPFKSGMQPWDGVFAEPYSTWLMCFYSDKREG